MLHKTRPLQEATQ